ncbi:MAG: F0F1 ATP synthase subunit B [Solobacterium sp.]|nr:F0F1 ATP synthase subunit B [Solobacterium sp.]
MIDIDVLGQLIPNPVTMLVQLCSTLILFLLMKKFLWASVQNFLKVRSDKMQSDLAASEQAKQEALSDRQKAQVQLSEASKKSEEIVSAAVRQAKQEKDAILAQADKEAANTKKKAHEQIEAERLAMYDDMKKEMVEVALAAAGKLIGESSGADYDRDAISAFIEESSDHGE